MLVKVPLRITLAGGGTDLPSFYEKHGGAWISAAIDKHIYVVIKDRFETEPRISYSKLEIVENSTKVEHPIIREALKMFNILNNVEVVTFADLPASTGLGSSGAFTTAMVVGLLNYKGEDHIHRQECPAETAFRIEHDILGRTTGRQDHYTSYFGGVQYYISDTEGRITHKSVYQGYGLAAHLMMFYTGITRTAEPILQQVSRKDNSLMEIQNIGYDTYKALKRNEYYKIGALFGKHWKVKRNMSSEMSGSEIDRWYKIAMNNGAQGGKLIGAGGGGFLLFYIDTFNRQRLRDALHAEGLKEVPFTFTRKGVEVFNI